MEMDRQTIMVLFAAIVGLTLFGGTYLSSPTQRDHTRPVYAEDDIRHKLQLDDAKKSKSKKKNKRPATPIISSSESSGSDASDDDRSNEEPSISDGDPQEEPALD